MTHVFALSNFSVACEVFDWIKFAIQELNLFARIILNERMGSVQSKMDGLTIAIRDPIWSAEEGSVISIDSDYFKSQYKSIHHPKIER